MNAAPSFRPALGERSLLSLLAFAFVLACGSDKRPAAAPAAGDTAEADRAVVESAGDVVIPAATGYTAVAVSNGGSVTGVVTLASALAPQAPIATGADSALCGGSVPDESVQQQGAGVGGVVVWLEGVTRGKPIPLDRRLELESDRCRLVPRVQATVVGSAVNVIGHDTFRQHLRWMAGGEKAPRAAILLGRNEQVIPSELPAKTPGMVVVRDVDHEWVRAFLAVFDHPYFAVTKPDGTFALDAVPPGSYTLHAWHERTKVASQAVTVTAGGAGKVEIKLQGR